MARRVFFSFHHERDIWRVNQVRNVNVVAGANQAGFFDHSEYEDARRKSPTAIDKMIRGRISRTSVTIVLIGKETASRDWVKREIELSLAQGNGLLGIYIHHLKDQKGNSAWFGGSKPAVPWGTVFPCYTWDKDLRRFAEAIELAGKRSEEQRSP